MILVIIVLLNWLILVFLNLETNIFQSFFGEKS